MSILTDFLIEIYASHFDVDHEKAKKGIRQEIPASVCFEIEDKKENIVQPAGQGVSVIRRRTEGVEVTDFEFFTKQIHGQHTTPSSCDFVISPCNGTDFLLLNELSKSKSEVILHFEQPETGLDQEGKLEKARDQLTATINRLYKVSAFCDQYQERIALFSCRLTDKNKKGLMARSARAFNKGVYKLERLRIHQSLPHGFIFKMVIYPKEYRI